MVSVHDELTTLFFGLAVSQNIMVEVHNEAEMFISSWTGGIECQEGARDMIYLSKTGPQ
jgi:hypothetical protein